MLILSFVPATLALADDAAPTTKGKKTKAKVKAKSHKAKNM